ncbi:7-carboxy-7-deazaguanine synthase QueE [Micromonospora rifamycinica]|uniref:7-carboxy-7-deazaguanine synthase QueE n=1 Tax=Micromonospora rifamycinica TaxID=291594 RepID=UPI002E2E131B|nr:7-carboxy-7-deazaguanine synthase QueE [Micromonospora rifamycinica]
MTAPSTPAVPPATTGSPVLPLLVAETFGPTLQGEGPSTGQQAVFLRLSRCNLSCPRCDTPYTWDVSRFDLRAHTTQRTAEDVVRWVLAQPTRLLVITGGEPLLQQDRLLPVVEAVTEAGRRVEIETNGTVVPLTDLVASTASFNVSPKLPGFAGARDGRRRINPAALSALVASGRAVFKFVATCTAELDEIARLQERFGLDPVWVMPEGTNSKEVLGGMRDLADAVIARGWHLSSRLHVLLWEDTRGR